MEIRFYLKDAPTVDNPAPVLLIEKFSQNSLLATEKCSQKKIARTAHGPASNLPSLALHAPTQNLTRMGPPRKDGIYFMCIL